MSPSIPDLIFSFIFLAPGYLAFIETLKASKIHNDYGKFDKTVYSLIFSGIILISIYLGYSIYKGTFIDLKQISDVQLITGFLVHLVISPIIGYLFGNLAFNRYYWRDKDVKRSLDPPYDFFFDNLDDSNDYKIRVKMEDSREISGYKIATDDDEQAQDTLLKFPKLITRNSEGSIEEKEKLGKYAYLRDDKISEIYTDDDIVVDGETL